MGSATRRWLSSGPGYAVRWYAAQVVPDEVVAGHDVRTALRRGPHPVVVVCGGCATWLAVGHRPDNPPPVLLACATCRAANDPRGARPVSGHGVDHIAPAGLAPAEVWVKSTVERVHALAAQDRRWPRRAG